MSKVRKCETCGTLSVVDPLPLPDGTDRWLCANPACPAR